MEIIVPLTGLQPGQTGTVRGIEGAGAGGRRLLELGFVSGTPVKLVRRAPFGDPLEFDIVGARFSLRREVARTIAVATRLIP